jgi:hypothetical protein
MKPGAMTIMAGDEEFQQSHLFTVRVWRGKVQHVASGEARYFRDWSTLVAFLASNASHRKEDAWE